MKTIGINKKVHADIKRMAKQHRLSIGEFVKAMTQYFKTSGEDPTKITSEEASPVEQIKNLDQRMVSFIRKQEQDFLRPIFEKIDGMIQEMDEDIDNETINKNIKILNSNIEKMASAIDRLNEQQKDQYKKEKKMLSLLIDISAYQKGFFKGNKRLEERIEKQLNQIQHAH